MTALVRERLKEQIHDLGDGFMICRLLPPPSRHAIGPFACMDHPGPPQSPATRQPGPPR